MPRILLVDDDHDILELGCALLAEAGYETFSADSVQNALRLMKDSEIDMLITDANMPGLTGLDLIRTVKRDKRHREITYVMLTGRRERKDIERAVEVGIHDYIVKPLDPMLFLQKVSDLLEKRPPKDREQSLASCELQAKGKAKLEIDVVSLSETGIIIRTHHQLFEGSRIELDSEIFMQIGIQAPLMRVLSSSHSEGTWQTKLVFLGADELVLTKIRKFIHAQSLRERKAA